MDLKILRGGGEDAPAKSLILLARKKGEDGEDATAKSLILLARKKSEDGEDAMAKSLKTWRGRARTKIPHTPYALALALRSRRTCQSRQAMTALAAPAARVGGGAP